MMSCALSSRYNVLKNEGTKNNHIGVPQTLLKLTGRHKICILELGTNHPGEIKALARIAAPDVAVITNIGPSHLEGLESLDGVFREKMGIAAYLKRGGSLILNGDDKFLKGVKKGRFRITRFGFGASNDFRASDLKFTKIGVEFSLNGKYDFRLSALGAHNVYNALAAIAVARHFGIAYGAIGRSLSKYAPPSMRLNLYRVRGVDIIDDSYNSNPLSMSSALDVLRSYPGGAKWVVSADMLELGRMSEFFHRSIGEAIAGLRVQGLLTLGELSRHTHMEAFKAGMRGKARHCSSHEEIADILRKSAKRGDVILVKGSRGMKMEEVVKRLRGRR
jgi:UDP-N-acetylmuramoyl-tripeptide--D-alanyl-D-alanine ligase